MPNVKQDLLTVLVLTLTVGIAVADYLLPQDIETDFLYTLPILLCVRTGRRLLPIAVAAISVTWTMAVDFYLAMTLPEPPAALVANTVNDLFGILSVIALGAFVAAYGNFMFALLICQDDRMWTLMVWLYQLQQLSGRAVVYASIVIASIPTFVVFILCQRVILRGIIVPSEK